MDYGQMMAEAQKAHNQYIIDHLNDNRKTYTAEEWRRKMEIDRAEYYAADHIACFDPDTGRSWIPSYEEWLEGQKAAKDWWNELHPVDPNIKSIGEWTDEERLVALLMFLAMKNDEED